MSRLETQIKNLRINPPDRLDLEVEDSVMESISRMPSPAVRHLRRRQSFVAGTSLAVLAAALLILFQTPHPKGITNRDYVENRVYLPGHTSIWLTPVVNQHGGK
jgi:hypothetical protein